MVTNTKCVTIISVEENINVVYEFCSHSIYKQEMSILNDSTRIIVTALLIKHVNVNIRLNI